MTLRHRVREDDPFLQSEGASSGTGDEGRPSAFGDGAGIEAVAEPLGEPVSRMRGRSGTGLAGPLHPADQDDPTSAIGLARYASDYFDAAIAADGAIGHRKGYEIVAPAPVMFLLAHSMELALKAYLRAQGLSVGELQKIGHSLDECWRVARDNGIEDHVALTQKDLEVLGLIGDLHASSQLRYIQTGFKRFPVFGPLEETARKLLDAICPMVGYR